MSAPWRLLQGDCLEVLRAIDAHSIDATVTDPPYGLSFMGKAWDYDVPRVDVWREVLRVLKPGGHLLSFFGSRTYHRGVVQIEDAGFEIRDSLMWLYGTGFPKSLTANTGMPEGQGTALKPAHEPIVLARKPLVGTVAANVQAHGTGGLNIDGCRIEGVPRDPGFVNPSERSDDWGMQRPGLVGREQPSGRWPANVCLDEGAAAMLDEQSGTLKSGTGAVIRAAGAGYKPNALGRESRAIGTPNVEYGDSGGASRFFYCAKASRSERDRGCEHLPPKSGGEATDREDGSIGTENPRTGAGRTGGARNFHPTVKPIALMRWLVRLVTPPGGTVLDPFTGSGTTGIAALEEGFSFIGIERDAEYLAIAEARLQRPTPPRLRLLKSPKTRRVVPLQMALFAGASP